MLPHGNPVYLGVRSKTVRILEDVKPSADDEKVLETVWGDNPEEITVDA